MPQPPAVNAFPLQNTSDQGLSIRYTDRVQKKDASRFRLPQLDLAATREARGKSGFDARRAFAAAQASRARRRAAC